MIKSMTGFGRGEAFGQGKKFTVELKAVNHRYCEIYLRLPRSLVLLEDKCKRLIQTSISRGRIDGFFSIEDCDENPVKIKVDRDLAQSYYIAMEELREMLQLTGKPALQDIVQFPNVLVQEDADTDVEQLWPYLEDALKQAITGLVNMRKTEGKRLYSDFKERINLIDVSRTEIEKRAPIVVKEYHKRLTNRINEWLRDSVLDQERLAMEVAIFAERSNITEELVRLSSHLEQMAACLDVIEPVGRKLDFLVQEMNREINTISSKANDLAIGRLVVEVKSELEKIREQVQNVE